MERADTLPRNLHQGVSLGFGSPCGPVGEAFQAVGALGKVPSKGQPCLVIVGAMEQAWAATAQGPGLRPQWQVWPLP